ncbi:MAG: hypothetical protein JJ899_07705 [Alphaproteobacteria bacterium]|nr:hypothetical protein [Alphaproteobacteria bacterium]
MRYSLIACLLALVTACQPVPRPFEADRATPNALLKLPDARGIIVQPVAHAPPVTADALAEQMVAALQDRNVPASRTGGNKSSMVLTGTLIDPGYDAMIAWTLLDPDGAEIGRYEQIIEGTPIEAWASADPELITGLARAAADPVAGWVQTATIREVRAPPIYVGPVAGTNPADAERLRTALRQALRGLGTRTAPAASDETLIARADVRITELADTRKEVAIAWRIEDPFGTEIGKIDQASPVPGEMVDRKWGQLARQAGVAAAAGMTELVSRIDWSQGFMPPAPGDAPAN